MYQCTIMIYYVVAITSACHGTMMFSVRSCFKRSETSSAFCWALTHEISEAPPPHMLRELKCVLVRNSSKSTIMEKPCNPITPI